MPAENLIIKFMDANPCVQQLTLQLLNRLILLAVLLIVWRLIPLLYR
jgi:hypothetical protein